MFKRFFFYTILALLIGANIPRAHAETPDAALIVEVKIWDTSIKDYSGFASGVLLNNNKILTDFHVAKFTVDNHSRYRLDVCLSNKIGSLPTCGYAAVPGKVNKDLDLAVLDLIGKALPISKAQGINLANFNTDLSALNVKKGSTIQVLGYPTDVLTYSKGKVTGYQFNPANNLVYVDSSAPAGPGDSGGGAFDQDNNFIGIVKGGKINKGKFIFTGIIPISTINYWLEQVQNSNRVKQTAPALPDNYTVIATESELCQLGDNDYCLTSQPVIVGISGQIQQPLSMAQPNQPEFIVPIISSAKGAALSSGQPSFFHRVFNWLLNR